MSIFGLSYPSGREHLLVDSPQVYPVASTVVLVVIYLWGLFMQNPEAKSIATAYTHGRSLLLRIYDGSRTLFEPRGISETGLLPSARTIMSRPQQQAAIRANNLNAQWSKSVQRQSSTSSSSPSSLPAPLTSSSALLPVPGQGENDIFFTKVDCRPNWPRNLIAIEYSSSDDAPEEVQSLCPQSLRWPVYTPKVGLIHIRIGSRSLIGVSLPVTVVNTVEHTYIRTCTHLNRRISKLQGRSLQRTTEAKRSNKIFSQDEEHMMHE